MSPCAIHLFMPCLSYSHVHMQKNTCAKGTPSQPVVIIRRCMSTYRAFTVRSASFSVVNKRKASEMTQLLLPPLSLSL